jgi:hypothetical protein
MHDRAANIIARRLRCPATCAAAAIAALIRFQGSQWMSTVDSRTPSRSMVARDGAVGGTGRGRLGNNSATMPPRASNTPLIDIGVRLH